MDCPSPAEQDELLETLANAVQGWIGRKKVIFPSGELLECGQCDCHYRREEDLFKHVKAVHARQVMNDANGVKKEKEETFGRWLSIMS